MQRMFVLALCLLVGACGSSTPSRTEADKKAASEAAALAVIEADLKANPAPAVTPTASASATAAHGPPGPKITTATFEPIYRASKAVQGATGSGVTYVKFGELMQAFSTEISIAKDHNLNESDKRLLAIYQEAYEAYHFSSDIWSARVNESADIAGLTSRIPLPNSFSDQIDRFKLTSSGGSTSIWVDGDSMQRVWQQADVILEGATAMYLGKPAPAT